MHVKVLHMHTCSQTLMCFVCEIFVSNSLQEVPQMTSPFIGPSGSAVHLSWHTRREKEPPRPLVPGWYHLIISNMGAEPHSAFSYSGKSSSFTFSHIYIQGLLLANINPIEQVELACHIKMVSCERSIPEWVPIVLGLLTWTCNFLKTLNLM